MSDNIKNPPEKTSAKTSPDTRTEAIALNEKALEIHGEKGGQKGPEPTRYGDWESSGRCTDF